MAKIRKAVIPAAGFGTRFLPQTKAMPKEMLPIVDKPVIQYVVEELVEAGITDIIMVTGYHKRTIEDHFDATNKDLIENLKAGGEAKEKLLEEVESISKMANFVYVRQKGPYGNGTPLLNVKHLIGNEPFIYTWSDDFIISEPSSFQQLISAYEKYDCSCLSAWKVKTDEDYARYGIAGGSEIEPGILDVSTTMEKPGKNAAPSDMAYGSGFLFTPDIFQYLDERVKTLKPDEELYYNDLFPAMLEDGKRILAVEIKGGKYYDTGNKLEYMKTNVELALRHPEISDKFREFLKNLDLS